MKINLYGDAMRENIMGVYFDNITLDEAVEKATELIDSPGNHYVVTPNSEIVYMTRVDKEFAEILNGADIVLPDGIGIVYASGILKKNIARRVTGIDFAQALIKTLAQKKYPLFLLGGKPGVAKTAAEKLKAEFPELIISGVHDGYFSDDTKIIDEINDSGAKVLFVCMGAPKQERWMRGNIEKFQNCKLMAGLGGALDVFSGEVSRAPDFFVRAGLEWLYRLIKEPKRIGRAMRLPLFLFWTLGAGMTGAYKNS